MVRPFKCRHISNAPEVDYFKPRGIPLCDLEEINLSLDELEAIRLADFDDLYHEQAAEKMKIARQTFSKILNTAHQKVADSLINGKAIKIEGGVYTIRKNEQPSRNGTCSKRGRRRRGC
jgi:uncharacterized protein